MRGGLPGGCDCTGLIGGDHERHTRSRHTLGHEELRTFRAPGQTFGATTVNDPIRQWLVTRAGRWAAAVAWGLFVLAASSIPSLGRLPLGERGADKFVHFCTYLILGYLVRRALVAGGNGRHSPAVIGVVLCTAWAMVDELHQAAIPLRSPEALDFLADVAGSATGVAVSHVRQGIEARLAKGDQHGNGP